MLHFSTTEEVQEIKTNLIFLSMVIFFLIPIHYVQVLVLSDMRMHVIGTRQRLGSDWADPLVNLSLCHFVWGLAAAEI